jgi:hypothetical protein
MDRRTFLTTAGAAVALLTTGATPAGAALPTSTPLFEWSRPGGFFNPGVGLLQPPPLAVYDDGTAYADAYASLRLPAAEVETLRRHAVEVVGRPHDVPRPDRPYDLVRVQLPDGRYLSAEFTGGPVLARPAAVHDLHDRVQRLRRQVLRGEIWRPPAALLAVVRLDHVPEDFRDWPVELPPPPTGELYNEQRLRGEAARTLQRHLPPAAEPVWPRYRVDRTTYVAATWRYLLPHE